MFSSSAVLLSLKLPEYPSEMAGFISAGGELCFWVIFSSICFRRVSSVCSSDNDSLQIDCSMSEGLIYHLALLILLEVTASGFCASFVSHLSSIDFVSIGDGSVLVRITWQMLRIEFWVTWVFIRRLIKQMSTFLWIFLAVEESELAFQSFLLRENLVLWKADSEDLFCILHRRNLRRTDRPRIRLLNLCLSSWHQKTTTHRFQEDNIRS